MYIPPCERCLGQCYVDDEGFDGEVIECPDCYGTGEGPEPEESDERS